MINSTIRDYLDSDFTYPIRDPLWKHVYMSHGLNDIIQHKSFLYLDGLRQLGPASYLYPGATHTRMNHSIGVFELARMMIRSLSLSPQCPPLSLGGVKAFLIASLLHDLGHYPHAHSLSDFPLKDHEKLSGEKILEHSMAKLIKERGGTDPNFTAAIIDKSIDWEGCEELLFYRGILSSPVDPDKLDYLNRDAYFCGVPYGFQDNDFIMSQIYPSKNGVEISQKGNSALENILFSKYLMYRSVYWHKSVRISTALIRKGLSSALSSQELDSERLYKMTDHDLTLFCKASGSPDLTLVGKAERPWQYMVMEDIPFCEDSPLHLSLVDRQTREELEDRLGEERGLERGEFLIDLPPEISFELPPSSQTVFTRPVVDGFTASLRRIRIIVPQEKGKVMGKGWERILSDRWVQSELEIIE